MGIRISKDHLHPSVIESITSLIGDLNQLETTAKGNAVEAINELLANGGNKEELEALIAEIAEGKELIANAVGEPLTAEESFDEMSTDINSLLSTFKTNMMNNGVTVNSGDKFKQLIDKMANLSENSGQIMQMFEGVINIPDMGSTNEFNKSYSQTVNLDLDFEPTVIFIKDFKYLCHHYNGGSSNDRIWLTNVVQHTSAIGWGDYVNLSLSGTTLTFTIGCSTSDCGVYSHNNTNLQYWAFGTGEDTTLRDSLASILEDEGVDVTEEDDMASLITKVDSEFDRKNANSGLDIISATELPATGKENQICVITDNPVDKFLVSSLDSDFSNLPNDTILLQTKHESTTHNYTVNNGNIISKYYISTCVQEDNIIPSYVYTSGQWVDLTPGRLYFVKNKQIITTTEFGNIYMATVPYVRVESDGIFFYSTETARGTCVTVTNKTNLSAFRKIHIVAKVSSGGSSSKSIGVYSSSTTQNKSLGSASYPTPADYVHVSTQTFTSKDIADGNVSFYRQEFDFDITDWTGEYYLGFYFYCYDTSGTRSMYIEEIYFY